MMLNGNSKVFIKMLPKTFLIRFPSQDGANIHAYNSFRMSSAQPSSRSIVTGSKVSACHISNWLIAVLGINHTHGAIPIVDTIH